MERPPGEITRIIQDLREGHHDAEVRLVDAVMPELKRRAAAYLRSERPGHTLQTTALVNEAYLALMGRGDGDWNDGCHFFAAAGQAMRRILVDYARQSRAAKRDGARHKVELDEGMAVSEDRLEEAIAVDEALIRLSELDPRLCRVVELSFFCGFTQEEIAKALNVSVKTVKRDWKIAKAWLRADLGGSGVCGLNA